MSYFLIEEIGDSETVLDKDFVNDIDGGNILHVEDDVESCCCVSSFDRKNRTGRRGIKNKNISPSDEYYQYEGKEEEEDDDDEDDSCSSRVINNVNTTDDSSNGGAKKKLKSSVSESFVINTISTRTGVKNMDEITDDRLFWDFCLAHGYP